MRFVDELVSFVLLQFESLLMWSSFVWTLKILSEAHASF